MSLDQLIWLAFLFPWVTKILVYLVVQSDKSMIFYTIELLHKNFYLLFCFGFVLAIAQSGYFLAYLISYVPVNYFQPFDLLILLWLAIKKPFPAQKIAQKLLAH